MSSAKESFIWFVKLERMGLTRACKTYLGIHLLRRCILYSTSSSSVDMPSRAHVGVQCTVAIYITLASSYTRWCQWFYVFCAIYCVPEKNELVPDEYCFAEEWMMDLIKAKSEHHYWEKWPQNQELYIAKSYVNSLAPFIFLWWMVYEACLQQTPGLKEN